MTNITYFYTVVRDDSSSADENSEGARVPDNQEGLEGNLGEENLLRLEPKATLFSAFGKGCLGFVRSVNLAGSSSGLKGESSTSAPIKDQEEKEEEENRDEMRERSRSRSMVNQRPPIFANRVGAELGAAGWPSWLIAVAGEAIQGWVPRRADSFEKFEKIGQGACSNVYKGRDLLSGKLVALKKVRFDLEPESVKFMAREILILRRLDHPNVVKLEGLVTSRMSCSLYLIFEYMEHDLAGLTAQPGIKFTVPQVKCYMHQLLSGLEHCHNRGVLHRDIKLSNLLLNNGGMLKIADFGSASFFDPNCKHPMTSRVVTLWYRPPELLLGEVYYGVGVDLWSTGCVLGELLAGKPIMPGRTEVEQLHKIFKLCGTPSEEYWKRSKLPNATLFKPREPYKRCMGDTFKDFPPSSLPLIETLLAFDPIDRLTAFAALRGEFFTTKPYACDPSNLPQYPPSKEMEAKLCEEKARSGSNRKGAAGSEGRRFDTERKGPKESSEIPAPDANAAFVMSMQKREAQPNFMNLGEKFNPHQEEVASGFPINSPRQSHALEETQKDQLGHYHNRDSWPGPLTHETRWAKSGRNQGDAPNMSTGADLSTLSSLVAATSLVADGSGDRSGPSQPEATNLLSRRFPGLFNEVSESNRKQDRKHQAQGHSSSNKEEYGRINNKDQILPGYGSKGNEIHYFGPLLAPSSNLEQMLKDHDHKIQELVRRPRLDKAKLKKI